MDEQPKYRAFAAKTWSGPADDRGAVLISHGRVSMGMSIAEARELSLELARAADEAELKLERSPS